MRAANDQASLRILHSLARAVADCTTKMGCRWRFRPNCLNQFMWFRYLSHMRAANDQASLHILHSLARAFADCTTKMGCRWRLRPIVYTSSCDLGIYRICEQQMIRRVCTFCTVSPDPSLIALQRWDVDEGSGQIVYTSSCDLGIYRICEQQMIRRACTFI